MSDGRLRPAGFLVLMLGLGLRLDTGWQGLASLLIATGAAAAALGLWQLARRHARGAFVPQGGKG